MLAAFVDKNREVIIARTRARIARRTMPLPTETELKFGVPLFLDQLIAHLGTDERGAKDIGASALLHGSELLKTGVTIGQVVHDYGDICQSITELAVELGAMITTADFRTLNLCLDVAIAESVSEYARQREEAIVGQGVEHLGFLAHELRNLLNTATLAFQAVRSGNVGVSGSTGAIVEKSLVGMNALVTRSLAEVRLASAPPRTDRVVVASLLEEIEIVAIVEAKSRSLVIAIEPSEPGVAIVGDAQIIASIVTNLLQNACKFTRPSGHITVRTRVSPERVAIDVEDQCGGLPPGKAEELFKPFTQHGADRSGLGLGLAIAVKGATAMGGRVSVRDLPGTGCVFTLEMPRHPSP